MIKENYDYQKSDFSNFPQRVKKTSLIFPNFSNWKYTSRLLQKDDGGCIQHCPHGYNERSNRLQNVPTRCKLCRTFTGRVQLKNSVTETHFVIQTSSVFQLGEVLWNSQNFLGKNVVFSFPLFTMGFSIFNFTTTVRTYVRFQFSHLRQFSEVTAHKSNPYYGKT